MTTKRQIRKLLKPLLERHPELVAIDSKFGGVIVVLAPVHHLIRGFKVESSGFADLPQQQWFFGHTFWARGPLVHFGRVRFQAAIYEENKWSHPRRQAAFIEAVEGEVLPLLNSIDTIETMLTFEHPASVLWKRALDEVMNRIYLQAAVGRFDLVDEAARELVALGYRKTYFWSEKTYREALEELWPLAQGGDRPALAALLHGWERQFIEAHGLQALYVKTPFSFENPPAL